MRLAELSRLRQLEFEDRGNLPGLRGRVAIVTGNRGGIGSAITELLIEMGVLVHGLDLPETDLRDFHSLSRIVDSIAQKEGRLDFLVNNAGATHLGTITEVSEDDLDLVIETNLKAPMGLMGAAIPHLIHSGGGAIVNISSDQAFVGKRASAIYGATKGAIAQLTRSAALDWAKHGIRVNCIAPGSTDTAMLRKVFKDLHQKYPTVYPSEGESFYRSGIPVDRFAHPREIAWPVAFLLSDASTFITGAVIPVDGGFVAQ